MNYTFYIELFKRKVDQSTAEVNLKKAIEIFKECGADGYLKKAQIELATIS